MEERRHSSSKLAEEKKLSDALLDYLLSVIKEEPSFLITSTLLAGEGRLYMNRNEKTFLPDVKKRLKQLEESEESKEKERTAKSESILLDRALEELKIDKKDYLQAERMYKYHEAVKAVFESSHLLQKEFHELTKQAFASLPERNEAANSAANIIQMYFNKLLASNPRWSAFEAKQKQVIREQLEKEYDGDELEKQIEILWNKLINHISGGIAFSFQSNVVQHAVELGIEGKKVEGQDYIVPQQIAADLLKPYIYMFNAGFIKIEQPTTNLEQEVLPIVSEQLKLDFLKSLIKKNSNSTEIESFFCKGNMRIIDLLYKNKLIAPHGQAGEAILHKGIKEMFDKMEEFKNTKPSDKKEHHSKKKIKAAMSSMAGLLLESMSQRYNDKLGKEVPARTLESLQALNELNKTMMKYAKRKDKKKYKAFVQKVEMLEMRAGQEALEKMFKEKAKITAKSNGKEKEPEKSMEKEMDGAATPRTPRTPRNLMQRVKSSENLHRKRSLEGDTLKVDSNKKLPRIPSDSGSQIRMPRSNSGGSEIRMPRTNSGEKELRRLPRTQSGDNLRKQKLQPKNESFYGDKGNKIAKSPLPYVKEKKKRLSLSVKLSPSNLNPSNAKVSNSKFTKFTRIDESQKNKSGQQVQTKSQPKTPGGK